MGSNSRLKIDDNKELDPVQIEREDHILGTLLDFFGDIRSKRHLSELHEFLTPQKIVTLEGIEKIIKEENLDQWLLKIASILKNRLLMGNIRKDTGNWPREDNVVLALFEIWYQLTWNNFDSMSKLILLEGLELLIVTDKYNHKLLRILDLTRNIAKENIKSDYSLRARIEKDS